MKINNLRNLISKYYKVEEELPHLAEIQKQTIIKQLKQEESLFITTANEFQFALRELFSQKKGLPLNCVAIRTLIKNFTQDDNLNFIYHIKQTFKLKAKNTIFSQPLPSFVLISKSELDDLKVCNNYYSMSLLPILLEKNLKQSDLIHEACWIIVQNNLLKSLKKECHSLQHLV